MFEAYSVGIRLRLIDGVSAGLFGLANQFQAFNRHVNTSRAEVKALEADLARLKTMGMLGGVTMGLGLAGLYAFKGPLQEAKQWQQEVARFTSLGFGDKVNKDAQAFALGMRTYGTSARDNMTLVSDAMAVFKNLGHAQMVAPLMAKMKFGNEAVFGSGTGAANERKMMDMLKVIEFRRGLSSPIEFAQQANFAQQAITGSRNRVDATQMLMALKTGGVAVSRLSNDAFYLGLEPLVQEFGGGRLGTGLMSTYQNLVQGRGAIHAQQELYRLGLLDPKMVDFNSMGMLKRMHPGAFRGSAVLEQEGPLALLQKVLLPAFAAKGITGDEAIIRELGLIMGNRTASGLMSRVYQQRDILGMQTAANRHAQNIDQLAATGAGTPEGKSIELHKKWADVMRELGLAVLPLAIKAVEGLTVMLKGFTSFARQFPLLTKALVVAFAGLAGLMVAGGFVTLVTAGFRALGLALVVGKGMGIGSLLMEAAGGFTAVGAALGKAGLVGAAGVAGYALGTQLNKLGPDGDLGGWLGGKVYGWTHSDYDPNATGHGSRVVRGSIDRPIYVTVQSVLDGRKVSESVTKRMGREVAGPQTGVSGFDTRLSPVPAGTW